MYCKLANLGGSSCVAKMLDLHMHLHAWVHACLVVQNGLVFVEEILKPRAHGGTRTISALPTWAQDEVLMAHIGASLNLVPMPEVAAIREGHVERFSHLVGLPTRNLRAVWSRN